MCAPGRHLGRNSPCVPKIGLQDTALDEPSHGVEFMTSHVPERGARRSGILVMPTKFNEPGLKKLRAVRIIGSGVTLGFKLSCLPIGLTVP